MKSDRNIKLFLTRRVANLKMSMKISNGLKKIFIIFFIAILVLLVLFGKNVINFLSETKDLDAAKKKEVELVRNKIYSDHHNAYINIPSAYGDLGQVKSSLFADGKIYGGIVSHHFFVAGKIAEFFAGLKKQQIETIVIVGPNHFNYSEGDIQISRYSYNTPWGALEPDSEIIENLLSEKNIKNEESSFEIEHSISALVGFVKYYLPEAKIVPIILKRKTTAKEAEHLAQALNDVLPEKSIVLASVDFSHHLNSIMADFHDELSVSAIKSFDYNRLYSLEIDSPASINVLLRYLESRGGQKMIYENTNSAELSGRPDLDDITSYMFAYFSLGSIERENKISLLNFGDAIFDREIEKNIQEGKNPFEKIKGAEGNFFKGTDFVSVNLELPAINTAERKSESINFEYPINIVNFLRKNKINLVNLASNRAFDSYAEEKNNISKYFDISNVSYFGGSALEKSYLIKKIGNKKIAFVSGDNILKISNRDNFYNLINKLKKENDYVAVSIRLGSEYVKNSSMDQVVIARALIDGGADFVIGHHRQAVRSMEIYKGKAIFYSLENFIFDQAEEVLQKGFGAGVVLNENKINFYLFPYRIIDDQLELLSYKDANEFCDNFLGDNKTIKPCYF